jgi:hypothetical protein
MLRAIRNIRHILSFSTERLGDYAELIQLELALFKQGLVRTLIGYVMLAACGMLCLTFLSLALLVTFWDNPERLYVAWGIAIGWCVLTLIAFWIAHSARDMSSTFDEFADELRDDITAIRESL